MQDLHAAFSRATLPPCEVRTGAGPGTRCVRESEPGAGLHPDFRGQKPRPGIPADIASTPLGVMGLPQPPEMNRLGLFP